MDINWTIIGIVAALVIILVVLTVRKNQKEKKKLTDLLNNDFKKTEEYEVNAEDSANEK
ncbi:FeoB-associated Cys-rich membrane protein [Flavobacterium endoglycinae]|uniref:FeoB-associated Cys-rich membrane protein n=1 Tax=Flavobacterium endoglycinae TaxID=2816357 RepID=A0ABX7Q9A1_9FLAO|nr:FeoB-associated Cys-rich membrane protein [Flavobacterium endoglycinae]QSW87223.1 FeoB-associated Cys-rich membrane protein [Flavobacterium endoglycinae]